MGKVRPKIGLALGSGGSRGYAHIGVLKVLQEENIPIDMITGSSMGALVGCLYGVGHSPDQLHRFASLFQKKYFVDFIIPRMGFVAGKKVKNLIRLLAKGKQIEDLNPRMVVVTTDINKGERVLFDKGDVASVVRASIAIPGIFVPEVIEGKTLVDGGVIDRVPVTAVKQMGADITIAVDVSYFKQEAEVETIYDIMVQSMDIMTRELIRAQEIESTVMIRPIVKNANPLAFSEVDALISSGEEATRNQIALIKEAIASWKENQT
ncbi:patatin-like phospholipase family protein [Halalkalibacter sp. APA_J-10(15)]|uniref:patatin-like phospholipase family protein n=1 Tax=unclassified Halalkalibacter TaxID=2893063 RepID=UPI001FF30A10|nr:patatin-like phospholipase family protein [Halalkalibacter sp. APA_J-10(15)]MCK0470644.1 patatin-like phospholipase family protein [Halalkalibacter sp. APA_J-10(15)]